MKTSENVSRKNRLNAVAFAVALLAAAEGFWHPSVAFDFSRYLFGEPPSLCAFVAENNPATGYVLINGGDSRQPSVPFTWNWGDGAVHDGWFPQSHTYAGLTENYVVRIVAHYPGDESDTTEVVVRFSAPDIDPVALPPEVAVTVPDHAVTLGTRLYDPPEGLTWFDDSFFDVIPRSAVEYVLSVASDIQKDFVNDDVYLVDGGFNQVVLRDAPFGGMYALWFTNPVCFVSGDVGFQGAIQWSSFLHEMGHNYTLNSPADYYYGGKIDGNANAIFSESMAQVFQHATAYEMINRGEEYGLSDDLVVDLKQSASQSIQLVRSSYDDYVSSGMNFASWNDPATPWDETFGTFMTVAYEFLAHAETDGMGYRAPLKRMMELLQVFDEDLRGRYDQQHNTAEADTFRATLMVAAVSHAFLTDLRSEFADLNFPISDATYDELTGTLTGAAESGTPRMIRMTLDQNRPNPFNPLTTISFTAPRDIRVDLSVYDLEGKLVKRLIDGMADGSPTHATWDATDTRGLPVASGVYFCRLKAGREALMRKMVLVR